MSKNPDGRISSTLLAFLHAFAPTVSFSPGVECLTQETQHAGHAHEIVANMSLQELEALDGILAVASAHQ